MTNRWKEKWDKGTFFNIFAHKTGPGSYSS